VWVNGKVQGLPNFGEGAMLGRVCEWRLSRQARLPMPDSSPGSAAMRSPHTRRDRG